MTGVEMRHVPYRGAGPAMQDVVAGRIDVIFDNLTGGLPQVQGGSARGLAVTTAKTLGGGARYSDARRVRRAGLRCLGVVCVLSAGQDAARDRAQGQRRHRRGDEASAGAATPGAARRRHRRGPPEELRRFLVAEMDKWGPLIREANIKVNE